MKHYIVKTTTQITFHYRQGKKPGIEFRHATRNASKNSVESGKQSVLTLCSLCLPYCEASFRAVCYIVKHIQIFQFTLKYIISMSQCKVT